MFKRNGETFFFFFTNKGWLADCVFRSGSSVEKTLKHVLSDFFRVFAHKQLYNSVLVIYQVEYIWLITKSCSRHILCRTCFILLSDVGFCFYRKTKQFSWHFKIFYFEKRLHTRPRSVSCEICSLAVTKYWVEVSWENVDNIEIKLIDH